MKYIITLLCTLAVIIIACNSSQRKESLITTPDAMKADAYTITIDRDTTLVTKHGALIKIPKGTLSIDKGNTVTLEIKEAYTIQQMIEAGLFTKSDGDPLSSGGMIYINAAAGQNITINQPIKVALPTNNLQKGMQLYKGVKDEKGNINWKDPSPIAEDPRITLFEQGQQLFQTKCASCHTLGKDGTGPDLAHFVNRFISSGWGIDESGTFITEHGLRARPANAIMEQVKTDTSSNHDYYEYDHYDRPYAYKCNLISKYNGSGPDFNPKPLKEDSRYNDEVDQILRYIQYESNRLNLSLPSHAYLNDCIDSCARYWETVNRLKQQRAGAMQQNENRKRDNGMMVEEKRLDSMTLVQDFKDKSVDFEETVSAESYGAVYYQFTIESVGWYNVDVLAKEMNGVLESELFVRITGEYREKVQVYLIIPSIKVYLQGGVTERAPDEFVFMYKDGKIDLPQNAKAYIMAVSETSESPLFGLKEFTITTKQQVDISLQPATREEFTSAINGIGADGLNITVADSKHAAEIRKAEAELKVIDEKLKSAESLKPKNCDCNCGIKDTVAYVSRK